MSTDFILLCVGLFIAGFAAGGVGASIFIMFIAIRGLRQETTWIENELMVRLEKIRPLTKAKRKESRYDLQQLQELAEKATAMALGEEPHESNWQMLLDENYASEGRCRYVLMSTSYCHPFLQVEFEQPGGREEIITQAKVWGGCTRDTMMVLMTFTEQELLG